MLSLVTAPATEPISLDDAKAHLRVDHTSENDLITSLITSFRAMVDGVDGTLNRALITQTWDLLLDAFPCGDEYIEIPLPPLQSIESFTYKDTDGEVQTLTSSDYFLDQVSEPARLYPAYGTSWPAALSQANSVTVRFVAGYGDDASDIPEDIILAGKLVIGHFYSNRSSQELPPAASHLLRKYRV